VPDGTTLTPIALPELLLLEEAAGATAVPVDVPDGTTLTELLVVVVAIGCIAIIPPVLDAETVFVVVLEDMRLDDELPLWMPPDAFDGLVQILITSEQSSIGSFGTPVLLSTELACRRFI